MSLAMGGEDDSFGLFDGNQQSLIDDQEGEGDGDETARLGQEDDKTFRMGSGKRSQGFEFGGSMAQATITPFSLSTSTSTRSNDPATPRRRSEDDRERVREAEEEEEEEEEDELLIEGFEGFSEEDQKRIRELRAERDELRGMNKILEQVVGALKVTEGNMSVRPSCSGFA